MLFHPFFPGLAPHPTTPPLYQVRSCRRRRLADWHGSPLAKIFTTADEYHLLAFRAVVSRTRRALEMKGLLLLDAFKVRERERQRERETERERDVFIHPVV